MIYLLSNYIIIVKLISTAPAARLFETWSYQPCNLPRYSRTNTSISACMNHDSLYHEPFKMLSTVSSSSGKLLYIIRAIVFRFRGTSKVQSRYDKSVTIVANNLLFASRIIVHHIISQLIVVYAYPTRNLECSPLITKPFQVTQLTSKTILREITGG